MLQDYYIENYEGGEGEALLVLRESIWNRETRDSLFGLKNAGSGNCAEGPLTFETTHKIWNSLTKRNDGDAFSKAAVRLCDMADFRELCRIFGERFAAVSAFDIRYVLSFGQREGGRGGETSESILTYMRVEAVCTRNYDEDVTSFFELVRYRDGDNFELYWDNLPDVMCHFSNGRARGCNVFIRGLIIYDIQTDGAGVGVPFALICPVIAALSRIAASQFDYIIPACDSRHLSGACLHKRSIWVSPEGDVKYTSSEEAIRKWTDYYGGTLCADDETEMLSILSASPGETLVIAQRGQNGRLSVFLEMQKRILKRVIFSGLFAL